MIAGYIGIAAAVAIAGAGIYAWDADKALDREKKARVTAELAAKGYADGLRQCRSEIAEKNAIINRFQGLPVDRLRICVTRPPNDPCCKPAPSPPGKDECKP